MKPNPAWVNAAYKGNFLWRNVADDTEPYIRIATTQGWRKALNPVWLGRFVPLEMRTTKQLTLAWLRITLDDGLTELDVPDWWPEHVDLYETKPER
jgi:hypothetical protein